jgi:hypothetical protein
VPVALLVTVSVDVAVLVPDNEAPTVAETDEVAVLVLMAVEDGVGVLDAVAVPVPVPVPLAVALPVPVPVPLAVALPVDEAVAVDEPEGDGLVDGVTDDVGVELKGGATMRIRLALRPV